MNYNYYIAQNNYLKQLLHYRRNPEVREEALRITKSLKLQKKEIEREYVGKRFSQDDPGFKQVRFGTILAFSRMCDNMFFRGPIFKVKIDGQHILDEVNIQSGFVKFL